MDETMTGIEVTTEVAGAEDLDQEFTLEPETKDWNVLKILGVAGAAAVAIGGAIFVTKRHKKKKSKKFFGKRVKKEELVEEEFEDEPVWPLDDENQEEQPEEPVKKK